MNPLFAAWVCWAIVGISPIAGKYAVGLISPALLVFFGTIIGVLYFAPWVTKNHKWGELFDRKNIWKFLFIGSFGTSFFFTICLIALHYTTPANAAIFQQSELLYSILFASIFLREIPSVEQISGSALIVLGVMIILVKERYMPHLAGDLMILGSTWMLQAGSTMAKKLPKNLDYRVIGMARNLFALPTLIIILTVMHFMGQPLTFKPTLSAFAVLGYTGVFKYGLAMVVWYKAIRALDLSKVTAIYLSYPVLSLGLSVLLGLDHPTKYQLLGMVLCCAGAYWISLTIKKEGH